MEHSTKSDFNGEMRDLASLALETSEDSQSPPKKTLSFHLSFLSLNILVFIVSIDATALGVAIPVRLRLSSSFVSY